MADIERWVNTDSTAGGDGTTNNIVGTSYTSGVLSDGTNQWQVRAIDNAGNPGDWSTNNVIIYIVVKTAPLLS